MKKATGYGLQATARVVFAIGALAASAAVLAQTQNCIELTTTAESEQSYVNDQGQQATRLVPVGKALPGDEVVWTVTAKNVCSKPVENVVVANPVPEHMTYVANSAMGVGTAITSSIDGKEFAAMPSVRDANGAARPATAEEIRHIRWTYSVAFAPGATAFVRYRATVN